MQNLMLVALILFFAVLIGYLLECRKYAKVKKKSDEIDKEIERIERSTDKLILSAYDKILSKRDRSNFNK